MLLQGQHESTKPSLKWSIALTIKLGAYRPTHAVLCNRPRRTFKPHPSQISLGMNTQFGGVGLRRARQTRTRMSRRMFQHSPL